MLSGTRHRVLQSDIYGKLLLCGTPWTFLEKLPLLHLLSADKFFAYQRYMEMCSKFLLRRPLVKDLSLGNAARLQSAAVFSQDEKCLGCILVTTKLKSSQRPWCVTDVTQYGQSFSLVNFTFKDVSWQSEYCWAASSPDIIIRPCCNHATNIYMSSFMCFLISSLSIAKGHSFLLDEYLLSMMLHSRSHGSSARQLAPLINYSLSLK